MPRSRAPSRRPDLVSRRREAECQRAVAPSPAACVGNRNSVASSTAHRMDEASSGCIGVGEGKLHHRWIAACSSPSRGCRRARSPACLPVRPPFGTLLQLGTPAGNSQTGQQVWLERTAAARARLAAALQGGSAGRPSWADQRRGSVRRSARALSAVAMFPSQGRLPSAGSGILSAELRRAAERGRDVPLAGAPAHTR